VICAVGKTANHAIVVAMLNSLGQNRGAHLFLVQLRDMSTHEPMPGLHQYMSLYSLFIVYYIT